MTRLNLQDLPVAEELSNNESTALVGGYGCYVGGYYVRPLVYHDTSHYDWIPGRYVRHGCHYHYIPGRWVLHRTGHFH